MDTPSMSWGSTGRAISEHTAAGPPSSAGGKEPTLQAVGAGAVNQAVKAVAIARSYLEEEGIELTCAPSFSILTLHNGQRTAVRLQLVEHRPPLTVAP